MALSLSLPARQAKTFDLLQSLFTLNVIRTRTPCYRRSPKNRIQSLTRFTGNSKCALQKVFDKIYFFDLNCFEEFEPSRCFDFQFGHMKF